MTMFRWLNGIFRFDGIQDNEMPADSDWQWLTPMERVGVQTQLDADCCEQIIEERKRTYANIDEWKN
jgi:hypothetical protein